jgi:hypothetical protein
LKLALVVFALVMAFAIPAWAHKPSDSYLTLSLSGQRIEGRWDVALRDLANVIDFPDPITWGALSSRQDEVRRYVLEHLSIEGCPITPEGGLSVASHTDGTYAVIRFRAECAAAPSEVVVDYRLFFDVDAQHRGLLRFEGAASTTHVVSAKDHVARVSTGSGQLARMIKEGTFHIWTGYDHVLFLLALLLPSVLRRDSGTWTPVPSMRTALVDVLRIVTAFTIAHSITLSLAALGVVTLPSRLIESAIAASVVLAALNNLRPILREDRWAAAFVLGLMHGFGFSGALMDLDLPRANLVTTLFGFNLGVELGQLAIVLVFVPLAFAVRASTIYRRGVLGVGSAGILALAAVWFVERAFLVRILP